MGTHSQGGKGVFLFIMLLCPEGFGVWSHPLRRCDPWALRGRSCAGLPCPCSWESKWEQGGCPSMAAALLTPGPTVWVPRIGGLGRSQAKPPSCPSLSPLWGHGSREARALPLRGAALGCCRRHLPSLAEEQAWGFPRRDPRAAVFSGTLPKLNL